MYSGKIAVPPGGGGIRIVLSEVKQHLAWSLFGWVAAEVRTLSLLDRKYVMINNSGLDAVLLFIIILFSPSSK
jgi:hypothetical protein